MVEPALHLAEPQPPMAQLVERRAAARLPTRFPAPLEHRAYGAIGGWALNLSATGMLVRLDGELNIWSHATATLPALGPREVRVVRRDGSRYGCLFACPLEAEELDAVVASPEAQAGFAAMEAEAAAPPPPRRGLLRMWVKRDRAEA